MSADGISMPVKKGTSACPAEPARRLGYINHAIGRKGHDRLWHEADMARQVAHVRFRGQSRQVPWCGLDSLARGIPYASRGI